ncbi:hypothetical protein BC938DRAFT_477662 [Jimgerdemannia flammicorona]|uniref:Uncharacterized protein n=1 Tax=Jimgerdemannia flammicorona TaxID=994334 RepID=A0A433QP34_9FUNG|nr:hypothetical protein BC938DRAFT_477662 [Jimgerdemannia flammicorona]
MYDSIRKLNQMKNIFYSVCPSKFEFIKWHRIDHVAKSVKETETPDNLDTEMSKHQHIEDNKNTYG